MSGKHLWNENIFQYCPSQKYTRFDLMKEKLQYSCHGEANIQSNVLKNCFIQFDNRDYWSDSQKGAID